ncbi:MAG: Gfo/Idh/MocA family oxidoreductase [Planctomycetota bacterium]
MAYQCVVVGTGFIGPVHAEAIVRAGQTLRGIVGKEADDTKAACAAFNAPVEYADFDAVLADDAVDAVHVCTPNNLHAPMAKAAMEAGKHVVCEKPLGMNAAETAELIEVRKATGKAAAVNHNLRFYPVCLHAGDMIAGGDLGEIYHVAGCYVQDWLLYDTDFNWRVVRGDSGALRSVADIGTHWMDMIQSLTGLSIKSVCATLQRVHDTRYRPTGKTDAFSGGTADKSQMEPVGVDTEDDAGFILIELSNGAKGTLWSSQISAGRKNSFRFEVSGSKAAVAWDGEKPNELWVGHRDRLNEVLVKDPALMTPRATAASSYPQGHAEGFPDTFKQLFKTFYGQIADGTFATDPKYPTLEDGHKEIVLCDAILKSHEERRWVDIEG